MIDKEALIKHIKLLSALPSHIGGKDMELLLVGINSILHSIEKGVFDINEDKQ